MSYQQVAWAWTEHLRHGGTTPWRKWVHSHAPEDGPPPPGWTPPGAAQLEFLRRAALRGGLDGRGFAELADLVAGRSGPGRGLGQQPLWWPSEEPRSRFGTPPVDPSRVPEEELVRIGVGTLTELLLAAPAPDDPRLARPRRPRRAHRRHRPGSGFAVEGAPVTAAALRHDPPLHGLASPWRGGPAPRVVLVAEPFDDMLTQVWSGRVQGGAAVRWHGFVRRWAGRSQLPPSVDLPALARSWADRVGTSDVHVLVVPDRSVLAAAAGTRPRPLSPAAVDVVRRVNAVLGVRVSPERHAVLLPRLVDRLPDVAGVGRTLTVPEPFQAWARERAQGLTDELRAGGYPVHGSLETVLPRFEGRPAHPSRRDALEVVLEACVAAVEGAVNR